MYYTVMVETTIVKHLGEKIMSNLANAIGSTDIALIKEVCASTDKSVADLLPPDFVCRAILADVDSDDTSEWYNAQRDLQRRAHALILALEPPTREDALADNFPVWVTKWWAPILMMPWSSSLGTAVTEAEQWLTASG